jgi:hypothetical protein
MMHGHEKSDSAIAAVKLANKAERSAAELVEPRAETKGNVGWQSTRRTQSRISVSKALVRIRQALAVWTEVGAVCGKAARTDLCGGREATRVPTATHIKGSESYGFGVYCWHASMGQPLAARTIFIALFHTVLIFLYRQHMHQRSNDHEHYRYKPRVSH